MTTHPNPALPADVAPLVAALRRQQQADMDGVFVKVSRQACDEAADLITTQSAALAAARAENERLRELLHPVAMQFGNIQRRGDEGATIYITADYINKVACALATERG